VNDENGIPYVRVIDVKGLKVDLGTAVKIPKTIHQMIQYYQVKRDDIVITIVGATIGKVGILNEYVEVCDFTENMARIRVKNGSVLANFLLHFLDSQFGRMQADRLSVGSSQFKLSLQSCRNMEIYLPFTNGTFNKEEQQNILNELYSVFHQIDEKRKQSDKLIDAAKRVFINEIGIPKVTYISNSHAFIRNIGDNPLSRLDALFNNPLREQLVSELKKHPNKPLGKLVKQKTGDNISPSDFYRLVELEQIDENTGRITHAREVPELGSDKILLKEGNLLISKLQPEKGKVVIVSKNFDGCVGSSELIPFVLDSADVSLEYLWAAVRSDYVLKQWEFSLTGSSRMRIGDSELKATIIPIVDRKIQDAIVEEIKDKILLSDNILKEVESLQSEAKERFITLLVGY
jgi:type I restriction enzyme S subunit